jgi:hypothetical protein
MGNDYGGRRADNQAIAPRASRQDVLDAASLAEVEVKRESIHSGIALRAWTTWWVRQPGDVWRTLANTNSLAVLALDKQENARIDQV